MDGNTEVRVRIAPSPTGDPHVGLAYITLFNYAFVKKCGGKLVLRIEDTDQFRSKVSSEVQILEGLRWLGLNWDEGPDVGGPYGPYRQSERRDLHLSHARDLVEQGHAYHCFCSAKRLDLLRAEQRAKGLRTRYDGSCRSLGEEEVRRRLAAGDTFTIRMKMPTEGSTSFVDELRGQVEINNDQLDDQILIKSDGFATYHLANVVDDHLMKITHVIRAEEWISSTPKHVILYQAFGWDIPKFVHMPLLRNHDRSKISKRKNPVSLHYYRKKGILPDAMVNFLALMGWSFSGEQEIFNLKQMIERFELSQIHLGGPVFDVGKLVAINQEYIQSLTPDEFVDYVQAELFNRKFLKRLYPLAIKRLAAFEEFVDRNDFFFNGALNYDAIDLVPKRLSGEDVAKMLAQLLERLDELYVWDSIHLQDIMEEHRLSLEWKPREYFMTVRLVVTGRKDSPPLAESMELIGREMVRFRLRDCLQRLSR